MKDPNNMAGLNSIKPKTIIDHLNLKTAKDFSEKLRPEFFNKYHRKLENEYVK